MSPRREAPIAPWGRSGGWLGTGDARLHTGVQVKRLLAAFARPLEKIDVLSAPHHGSGLDSGKPLYSSLPRRLGLALMNADRLHSHPHAEVVAAALEEGHAVVRVGAGEGERVVWSVSVRPPARSPKRDGRP